MKERRPSQPEKKPMFGIHPSVQEADIVRELAAQTARIVHVGDTWRIVAYHGSFILQDHREQEGQEQWISQRGVDFSLVRPDGMPTHGILLYFTKEGAIADKEAERRHLQEHPF